MLTWLLCVCVCIYLCLCVPEYLYIVREKSQAAFPYVHLMFQLQASSATCRTRFLALNKSYLHPLHISLQFLLAAALVTECIVKALHPQKKKKKKQHFSPTQTNIWSLLGIEYGMGPLGDQDIKWHQAVHRRRKSCSHHMTDSLVLRIQRMISW